MVVFAGQGDADRSMALLWRAEDSGEVRTGPGPKPGLSVDLIVDAAISVADEEGMAALSMRAVGQRLGRTAMALYTYVPSKGELLDLMYDQALAELPTEYGPDWRSALSSWAEENWKFYLRHPWMLHVSQARPVLGPNEFTSIEALVRILRGTELPRSFLRGIVGALTHFVRGAAQTVNDARTAAKATGISDDEWWYGRSPMLTELVPDFDSRFPMLTWIESDNPLPDEDDPTPYMERDARQNFEAGLGAIVSGIEAAIASQRAA